MLQKRKIKKYRVEEMELDFIHWAGSLFIKTAI